MASKSKFFRVAVEGATTDGRNIERKWIEQMAKNFDPKKYGARIWLEHFRGIYPDSSFRAYGDVTAVEARKESDGKMALYAQITPLPDLVELNKKGQKIYSSIEVDPEFADTGEAYLVGLAVTDSPASLGTEMLTFAQKSGDANPFNNRKSRPGTLFTEAVAVDLEFDEEEEDAAVAKFSQKLKSIVGKFGSKAKGDDTRFGAVLDCMEEMAEAFQEKSKLFADLEKKHDQLSSDFSVLKTEHDGLVKTLEKTPSSNHSQRPVTSGGSAYEKADC